MPPQGKRGKQVKKTTPHFFAGPLNAVNAFIAELRKVIWPSRGEVIRLSTIVIAVAIAIGILLGAVDYGFTQLAKLIFP